MAISAYVGVPGSGKSYEVVKSVLLPAFLAGRRIVTNIEGISEDKFREYALRQKKITENQLGTIVHVSDKDVMREDFFPYKNSTDTVCHAGDLIAIDELWRVWPSDNKIPENHRSFIAEHRHFTDEQTGICCDLVVINQSVANLPRFLKDRIETTYRMSKHLALGLKSRYRVDVFNGVKLYKTSLITSYQERYNKEIFALYKSYDGSNGKESTTDKRQNIFSSKRILFFIVFFIILLISSVYFIVSFFSTNKSTEKASSSHYSTVQQQTQITSLPVQVERPAISQTWRVTGKLKRDGKAYAILMNSSGGIRLEPLSQFKYKDSVMIEGEIDGEKVTRYSGGVK